MLIKKMPGNYATYCRSFLVTLGLAFAAGAIATASCAGLTASWPWFAFVLLALTLGGAALVLFGLFGPSNQMASWAGAASTHAASIILLVLAYPVYLVLSPFYDGAVALAPKVRMPPAPPPSRPARRAPPMPMGQAQVRSQKPKRQAKGRQRKS